MKKRLILLILVLLVIFYFLCVKTEKMTNIDYSKSIVELMADVNALQADEMLWEKIPTKISKVIEDVKKDINACGVNGVDVSKEDLAFADSRLKFIKMLPVTKLFNAFNYEKVKCFVNNIDRTNLVSWIKTEPALPKYLLPRNIIIVNDSLYQSSPYGVIKYKVPALKDYAGNDALNGTIESSLLNDFNIYNRNMDIAFSYQGTLIRKVGTSFVDLKTGESYAIKKLTDRVELLNSKVISETSPEQIANKFEDKPKAKSEVKTEVKAEAKTVIAESKQLTSAVQELKGETPPDVKAEIKTTVAKVVATSSGGSRSKKSNSKSSKKSSSKKASKKASKKRQRFTNTYEGFSLVGFTDNVPVTGKDSLQIPNSVIDDILTSQGDVKYIKSQVGSTPEVTLNRDVIFAADYEGIPYLFARNEILPRSKWANSINKILSEGKMGIKTVIPHYYHKDGQFKTRFIVVLDNDFYTVVENNVASEVKDFAKDMGVSFSEKLGEVYSCKENKVFLEQMQASGIIDEAKKLELIKQLNC